ALAGRDPEPNTTIRKEEATWSRTSSCRCGSEQFIQKENFPEFTYRLFVLWNRVIYTKLLTHPSFSGIKGVIAKNESNVRVNSYYCYFGVTWDFWLVCHRKHLHSQRDNQKIFVACCISNINFTFCAISK